MNKTVFEEGIKKGIEKGRSLDRQELVLATLEEPVSAPLRHHVETLSMADLRRLISRIPKAGSLADLGLAQVQK